MRSGKTFIQYFCIARKVAELRGKVGDVLIIGKTQTTAYRNIVKPMEDLFGLKNVRYLRGQGEVNIFGRKCYILGADDEKAKDKIMGGTVALAIGDELTLWPITVFEALITRLSLPYSQFFGTTNPDSPFHPLKQLYIDKDLFNVHTFKLSDNATLPEDYLKYLQALSGVWYRRWVLGEWCIAEGQIYDSFSVERNVFEAVPQVSSHSEFLSADYGTGTTTAVGFWWKSGHKYWLMSEYRYSPGTSLPQKTDSEYVIAIRNWLNDLEARGIYSGKNGIPFIVDKTASSFKQELMRNHYVVYNCNNDVLNGIRAVNTALALGDIQIHKSCDLAIKEFSTYCWDPKKQEIGLDAPLKKNDHSMDEVRYAYYTWEAPVIGRKILFNHANNVRT